MRTQRLLTLLLTGSLLVLLSACSRSPQDTGIEYAPAMYHSLPYEPYSQMDYNPIFKDKKNAQDPVPGTIARGQLAFYYPYPNNNDGYEAAKNWKNPLTVGPEHAAEGKRLYTLFCVQCHGAKGDGNGPIAVAEKFPQPPSYYSERLLGLADGQMFHSITYGKGVMGSHRGQLNPNERWQIIQYVRQLQQEGLAASGGAASKSIGDPDGIPPANNPNNANLPVKPTAN